MFLFSHFTDLYQKNQLSSWAEILWEPFGVASGGGSTSTLPRHLRAGLVRWFVPQVSNRCLWEEFLGTRKSTSRKQEVEEVHVGRTFFDYNYIIKQQMVLERFLFFLRILFGTKMRWSWCLWSRMDGDVSMLISFSIYKFISKPDPPEVTRCSRRYPILQHRSIDLSSCHLFRWREFHPCHSLRALHVRWVRRLGQRWATKRMQLSEISMQIPERCKSHWKWIFKNFQSSKRFPVDHLSCWDW